MSNSIGDLKVSKHTKIRAEFWYPGSGPLNYSQHVRFLFRDSKRSVAVVTDQSSSWLEKQPNQSELGGFS